MVSLQPKNTLDNATKSNQNTNYQSISESDLIEIVQRASTIAERLSPQFVASETTNNEDITRRWKRWHQVVGQGEPAQFAKRLAWDNLNPEKVKQVLGTVKLAQSEPLPRWAKTLKAALEKAAGNAAVRTPEESEREPIPFEPLFLPFVAVAEQRLMQLAGSSYERLNADCHQILKLNLLAKLSGLCARTMELEFKAFRAYRRVSTQSKTRWFGQFPGSKSTVQYDAFIAEMQSGKFFLFFQEYSVLGRLAATLTDFWVEAIAEFLQRLDADWAEIEQTFDSESSLDKVVSIRPFLSDNHHNGRTVFSIEFASQLKLIYKPKDIGQEVAYFQLLDWLNQHNAPLSFKLFKTLNRSTHGWVEFVEQLPCETPESAQRYYQRAGILLCLLYVIEGTDVHHENIVACGEHPVLVDMETLFHHRVKEIDSLGDSALDLANEQMQNSVLRTYMLPRWEFGIDGQSYDISGLGGFGGRETPLRVPQWENINTDLMKLTYEKFVTQASNNVPFLDSEPVPPQQHIEDLVEGFRQMYRFILSNQESLLAPDSPLGRLAPQRVRFIFRHTKIYASVMRTILSPQYLKNGADRSIEIEILSLAMLKTPNAPVFWPLLQAEIASLEQLDIPMFVASSDSDSLVLDSGLQIDNCFAQSSYDLVKSRIKQLDERDLETQVGYIWGTIYASSMEDNVDITKNIAPSVVDLSDSLIGLDRVAHLTPEALVEQSVQIAHELKQKAIYTGEGSATWISLTYREEAQQYEMLPMGLRLFDGCSGVALFLAGLTKITQTKSHRDLTLATIAPILRGINLDCDRVIQEIGIGGGMGAGALIYTLVRTGQMLDTDFLTPARQVAATITDERISQDCTFDLLGGSAGAILGLLALYQIEPDEKILERAIACGRHLLASRTASASGHRAWITGKQSMLTGFSHGAAGIAYALGRLFAVTQQAEFLNAAIESNAYEASVFIAEQNNWPDFRYPKTEKGYSCWNSWCHGASGIGLARVAELGILPQETIESDIAAAIATAKTYPLERIDQLCCGNLGRVEFLLNAAQKLKRSELQAIALERTSQVVARANYKGKFGLNWETGPYDPSFFQGTSGIGYQLLRMAHPNLLPSILVWE